MLGKLIKHEFKHTSKLIFPLWILLAVITVLGRIVAQSIIASGSEDISNGMAIFHVITIFIYIFGVIVISFTSYIYLIVRFQRSLFGAEGYLMHTLPVTPWQLLLSKTIVSFIWMIAETLLTLLSIFCIFASGTVFDQVSDFLNSYGGLSGLTQFVFGMTPAHAMMFMILFILISTLSGILVPYLCICIGQLWQQHKTAGTFLAFVVILIISQIIGAFHSSSTINPSAADDMTFVVTTYHWSMIQTGVMSVLSFIGSGLLMKKKVNLD